MRRKGVLRWEEERVRFFEDRGMGMEEVEKQREEGKMDFGKLIKKDKD